MEGGSGHDRRVESASAGPAGADVAARCGKGSWADAERAEGGSIARWAAGLRVGGKALSIAGDLSVDVVDEQTDEVVRL